MLQLQAKVKVEAVVAAVAARLRAAKLPPAAAVLQLSQPRRHGSWLLLQWCRCQRWPTLRLPLRSLLLAVTAVLLLAPPDEAAALPPVDLAAVGQADRACVPCRGGPQAALPLQEAADSGDSGSGSGLFSWAAQLPARDSGAWVPVQAQVLVRLP